MAIDSEVVGAVDILLNHRPKRSSRPTIVVEWCCSLIFGRGVGACAIAFWVTIVFKTMFLNEILHLKGDRIWTLGIIFIASFVLKDRIRCFYCLRNPMALYVLNVNRCLVSPEEKKIEWL